MSLKPTDQTPGSRDGARRLAWLLAGLVLVLGLFPAALPALDWNRAALADGQWQRLFTAHLVHLNLSHLLLNLLALLLLAQLFWNALPIRTVLALLATSAIGISLGLLWLTPDLWRYAGLSGVLHGAWAGSALLLLQQTAPGDDSRLWWAFALLGLAAKLAVENFSGHSLAGHSMGMAVILPSHALGALAGISFAGLASLAGRMRRAAPAVASAPLFD